jgi:hypothetical protein
VSGEPVSDDVVQDLADSVTGPIGIDNDVTDPTDTGPQVTATVTTGTDPAQAPAVLPPSTDATSVGTGGSPDQWAAFATLRTQLNAVSVRLTQIQGTAVGDNWTPQINAWQSEYAGWISEATTGNQPAFSSPANFALWTGVGNQMISDANSIANGVGDLTLKSLISKAALGMPGTLATMAQNVGAGVASIIQSLDPALQAAAAGAAKAVATVLLLVGLVVVGLVLLVHKGGVKISGPQGIGVS